MEYRIGIEIEGVVQTFGIVTVWYGPDWENMKVQINANNPLVDPSTLDFENFTVRASKIDILKDTLACLCALLWCE